MARSTRQLASFGLVVRELIPGREYSLDRILALCRAKDPRFGFSTLSTYLRAAVSDRILVRNARGIYSVPDAQGGSVQRLAMLGPSDPEAELGVRLVHIEEGVLLGTQQQALLDQKLDHILTLLRRLVPASVEVPDV